MGTQENEEGERDQEGRKEDEDKEAEEGGGEQVKKDVTDWVEVRRRTRRKRCKMVQIFVKVNGSKATPIEVNLTDDKVEDIVRQVQNDEDAYVTMQGKVLKTSEKLKSCGVTDGCTIQVTSRMRGGGKHKDKKSKLEKKQVTRREPVRNEGPAVLESEKEADGLCAMVCEQMRWAMETMNTLQSTDEDKRRIAEEVEKVKKAMAGMEKQATGGDLQRVAEMEESFKKLEKKVQAKDVETGEKKVTREGRGCTGLVQGGDETHKMNETSGKGKGKGNGGKGEHGGKGDKGGKGFQQNMKTMKGEEEQKADEVDERDRVAPNMGAGGSHPQAKSDPGKEKEKKETRVLSWADCNDEEVRESEEEVEQEKETRQWETTEERPRPPGLEEEVESESKTQQEKEPSQVENAQESRELKRAQEAREEERRAQEAREQKRAQEAREEERRAQEAREQTRAQKAREEEQRRAREAREEEKAQEMRREKRVQEAREKEAKAQEEQEREVETQGGHEDEVKAQGGHESEVKAHGGQEEDAKSLHEECHVSNRHMTWWHNAWWVRVDNGPHMRSARGRRRTWRAARQAAEQVRDGNWVGEARWEERERLKKGERGEEGQHRKSNEATLHLVLHVSQQPQNAAAAAAAAMQQHQ